MDFRKIGFWQLVIMAFLLNIIVQLTHESGHWIVCETLGKKPVWGFNQLLQMWGDPPPIHPDQWITTISPGGEKGWLRLGSSLSINEFNIMLAAGPVASILGAILGLSLMYWNSVPITRQMGLVMALTGSFIMSMYYLRGFSRMGGDEYFLAANLGIHKYIIDIPFGLSFITVFIAGILALGDWRTMLKWFGAMILGSLPSGLLIMKANSIVLAQVNLDNQLFRPLLGWSLPVIIVNIIVCLVLLIWWKQAKVRSSIDLR